MTLLRAIQHRSNALILLIAHLQLFAIPQGVRLLRPIAHLLLPAILICFMGMIPSRPSRCKMPCASQHWSLRQPWAIQSTMVERSSNALIPPISHLQLLAIPQGVLLLRPIAHFLLLAILICLMGIQGVSLPRRSANFRLLDTCFLSTLVVLSQ